MVSVLLLMAALSLRGGRANIELHQNDEYYTPKEAWQQIQKYLPKDKLVWEAFRGNGQSAIFLRELGCNVICEDVDFFEADLGEVIVSNPPYSCKAKVFERLRLLDKPFIMLMPIAVLSTHYYQKYFAKLCGVIVPKYRIHFLKGDEDTKRCWFNTIYFCYKIDGINPREIIYLD